MANLYYAKDIRKLIEKEIEEFGSRLITDHSNTEEQIMHFIKEVRIFKKYADEFIEELEEKDREDEERRAREKAERDARTVTIEVNQDDN